MGISRIFFIGEQYSVMFFTNGSASATWFPVRLCCPPPPRGQAAVWELWKYPASLVFQDSGRSASPLFSSHRSSPPLRRSCSGAVVPRRAPDSSSSSSGTSRTSIPTAQAASSGRRNPNETEQVGDIWEKRMVFCQVKFSSSFP